ncbi:hypothetical protein HPB50_009422 [Hyalomma asiaticum]|uniref:Uncharacterized protein n=1 Tax=Hyalomma asiaticum TaxID=266040 RepID=A0ACB7RVQ7_HYAAI|nr:hypothetical protein HPB50_009422 [Hyalomma asiaticum]
MVSRCRLQGLVVASSTLRGLETPFQEAASRKKDDVAPLSKSTLEKKDPGTATVPDQSNVFQISVVMEETLSMETASRRSAIRLS